MVMYISRYGLPDKHGSKADRRQRCRAIAEQIDKRRRRARIKKRRAENRTTHKVRKILSDSRHPRSDKIDASILARLGGKEYYRPRVETLTGLLTDRAPRLLREENALVLNRVVRQNWIRPPDNWRPRGKGRRALLRSLADHLIARYPVPEFVCRAFFDPNIADEKVCKAAPLFAALARGESVGHCIESSIIVPPMTRRMRHMFLQSPPDMPLVQAVLRALVLGYGGDASLAAALLNARIFNNRCPKLFWADAVHWFCRQPCIELKEIQPLIDYMGHRHKRDRTFNFRGRTLKAMMRGMNEWHQDLALERRLFGLVFKPSGLTPGLWTVRPPTGGDSAPPDTWKMREILSSNRLVVEGRSMDHCVADYAEQIVSNECSIWSLQCNGRLRLTVEVDTKKREVAQARGKGNRMPKKREKAMIRHWATENTLAMTDLSGGW